jgi:hypothetical protein
MVVAGQTVSRPADADNLDFAHINRELGSAFRSRFKLRVEIARRCREY